MRVRCRLAVILFTGLAIAFPACTENTPPSLLLALYTNDLAIAGDTNLVGLYVSQIGSDGRVLHVAAYEQAPLRLPNGQVVVPFPASLVLLRGEGQTESVHVRLIAYRKDTRNPLTMREARTTISNIENEQRLLRLNLFFTSQDNVVDTTPGEPLLVAADGAITSAAFARFVSICDGGPAPSGKTAGDTGRCIDLDVPLDALPTHDPKLPILGSSPRDACFDVDRAFTPGPDVARFDRAALAPRTDGSCELVLPAVQEPISINVALLTTDAAFETAAYEGLRLRPLAKDLAFTIATDRVTLPPAVCALANAEAVRGLLISSRTSAWAADQPVCAPWVPAQNRDDNDAAGPSLPQPSGSTSSSSSSGESSSSSGGIEDAGSDADASDPADAEPDAQDADAEAGASFQLCGDAQVTGTETCDDGGTNDNDGCSSSCAVEPGYVCPAPGQPCIPS